MLRIAAWFARTASAVTVVFLLALAAVPSGVSAQGAGIIAVGYGEGGYQYLQVAPGDGAGFEQPGYDASGWAIGAAAFGSPGIGPCNVNYDGRSRPPGTSTPTCWSARRSTSAPAPPTW